MKTGSIVAQGSTVVGTVSYITPDGWVGVDDGSGRVDEYHAANLTIVKGR